MKQRVAAIKNELSIICSLNESFNASNSLLRADSSCSLINISHDLSHLTQVKLLKMICKLLLDIEVVVYSMHQQF